MKNQNLMNDLIKGLLMAAVVAVGLPDLAMAQAGNNVDLAAEGTALTTQVATLPQFVSALFWVAGAVMIGAGILKCKEHAENPTQTPLRQGLSRLIVGALLLTIPFFAEFVAATLSAGTAQTTYTIFNAPAAAG